MVLGYNITHTTEFDYDRIDLRFVSTETITKMVSLSLHIYDSHFVCVFLLHQATINYKYNKETGKIWRSKINPKLRIFSDEVDPPGYDMAVFLCMYVNPIACTCVFTYWALFNCGQYKCTFLSIFKPTGWCVPGL